MMEINKKTYFYLIIASFVIILSLGFIFLYNPSLSGLVVLKSSPEIATGTYNNTSYNQSGFVQISSGTSGSYMSIVFDANATTGWESLNLAVDVPSATLTQQIKPSSAYYTDKDKTNDDLSSSQMSKINNSDNSRFSFESRNGVDANLTLVWNANIPLDAQINSAVLSYEHQEAEDMNVSLKGSIYSNGVFVDVCTFTISEDNDVTDSCDLSSYLATPAAINNLNFMVTFNRNGSSKAEKTDFVALNVTYTLDTSTEIFVHSCDDGACSGEGWNEYSNGEPLSESENRYFQYIAYFYSDSAELTPKLYNATVTFNTAPTVQFNSPANNEVISINSTLLNVTVFDNNLDDMTVWIYGDSILLSITNNATNGTALTYNFSNLADGQYNWTAIANDGTSNSTLVYRYFNISLSEITPDTTKPSVEPISPLTKKYSNKKDVTFRYEVNDESNITNCSLILNGEANQTAQDVARNSTESFILALGAGKYRWQIACTDSANNTNISESRRIFIVLITSFDGDTTNITALNSEVIHRLVLEKSLYGKINFSEEINLSEGADIDVNVNISASRIEINSIAVAELNKSAVVTLYNISYNNPRIIRDGVVCPDTICQLLSFANGTLKINLSSFSVYTIDETPQPPLSSGGGGEGGSTGGGGCLAKWNCTLWSECAEGKQIRICTKVPEYCYGGAKPLEEQKCNSSEAASTEPVILGETGGVATEKEQNVPKQKENTSKTIGIGAFIAELPLKIKLALLGNVSSIIVLALIVFRFFIPLLKKEEL